MKIIENKISTKELKEMSSKMFGNLVKAVVDVEENILVVDAELHSDQEAYLLQLGSKQENLWSINIYPDLNKEERIEFDSMINLRPSQGNNSRGVESEEIQRKILDFVNSKLEMNNIQHENQSKGEWIKKSFLEQMANIGSEVYRAISWKEKNEEYSNIAFIRSLELFDLTKSSKLTSSQYRELTRMREIWVDYFKYDNQYNSTQEGINKYFMYLTIAFKNL